MGSVLIVYLGQSIEILCEAEKVRLGRLVQRIVGNASTADEIVQDAFLNLINAGGGTKIDEPGAYFTRAARNLALNRLRHMRHGVEISVDAEIYEAIADRRASPELELLYRQELHRLLMGLCREEEPLTTIATTDMTAGGLLAAINRDLIAAGFIVDGEAVEGFVREEVWSERPVVVLPRQHPLLSYERVPFREALRYPLVLCHPELCAGGYRLFRQSLHARACRLTRWRNTSLGTSG